MASGVASSPRAMRGIAGREVEDRIKDEHDAQNDGEQDQDPSESIFQHGSITFSLKVSGADAKNISSKRNDRGDGVRRAPRRFLRTGAAFCVGKT